MIWLHRHPNWDKADIQINRQSDREITTQADKDRSMDRPSELNSAALGSGTDLQSGLVSHMKTPPVPFL